MNRVELLAPAGDLEKLKIAIEYGADAVFCGGKQFSLRAKANNFSIEDLKEAVKFANAHNAKVHVTVNIVPEDHDLKTLDEYLLSLNDAGVHAIIVSSVYIMKRAKELKCNFEVHVSTQQSIANHLTAKFFKENLNVERVVLARELNIDEIKEIKEKANMPIEGFIHGGMCSSYSGRCTLSNVMASRDANKGGCAHSCRWTYHLYDDNNPIGETNFIIASCDLMSIEYVPLMLDANIDSFKIEGRMKSAHYIATVVNAYRRLIDEYYDKGKLSQSRIDYYKDEIKKAENRITYTGFLNKEMKHQALLLNTGVENPTQAFIAFVIGKDEQGYTIIEVRNYFEKGDKAECFTPSGKTYNLTMPKLYTMDNEEVLVARHPKQILKFKSRYDLPINTFIRKK